MRNITMQARILSLFILAMALLPAVAYAIPVVTTPSAVTYDIQAVARNGRSGFEATLFTPGTPPPTGVPMNPAGAPAWSYGNYHPFEFIYTAATGVTTWKIDFNRDGDFLDAQESATSTSPALAGYGHKYVNLYLQGRDSPNLANVNVRNFTINDINLGAFASNDGTVAETIWGETNGIFLDVIISGELSLSASGNTDERPRLWVRLGDPTPYVTNTTNPPGYRPAFDGINWTFTAQSDIAGDLCLQVVKTKDSASCDDYSDTTSLQQTMHSGTTFTWAVPVVDWMKNAVTPHEVCYRVYDCGLPPGLSTNWYSFTIGPNSVALRSLGATARVSTGLVIIGAVIGLAGGLFLAWQRRK